MLNDKNNLCFDLNQMVYERVYLTVDNDVVDVDIHNNHAIKVRKLDLVPRLFSSICFVDENDTICSTRLNAKTFIKCNKEILQIQSLLGYKGDHILILYTDGSLEYKYIRAKKIQKVYHQSGVKFIHMKIIERTFISTVEIIFCAIMDNGDINVCEIDRSGNNKVSRKIKPPVAMDLISYNKYVIMLDDDKQLWFNGTKENYLETFGTLPEHSSRYDFYKCYHDLSCTILDVVTGGCLNTIFVLLDNGDVYHAIKSEGDEMIDTIKFVKLKFSAPIIELYEQTDLFARTINNDIEVAYIPLGMKSKTYTIKPINGAKCSMLPIGKSMSNKRFRCTKSAS